MTNIEMNDKLKSYVEAHAAYVRAAMQGSRGDVEWRNCVTEKRAAKACGATSEQLKAAIDEWRAAWIPSTAA